MNRYVNSWKQGQDSYYYCDLKKIFEDYPSLKNLPNSLKLLLETNIRNAKEYELEEVINTFMQKNSLKPIKFFPTRLVVDGKKAIDIMQESAYINKNMKNQSSNIMIDFGIEKFLLKESFENNLLSFDEKNDFIKWLKTKYDNLSLVSSNFENIHQVNLEYLSTLVSVKQIDEKKFIYPELLMGVHRHTSMVNALGVLAWKFDEIDIQTALLDSNISLEIPKVIGVEIIEKLDEKVSIFEMFLCLLNLISTKNIKAQIIEFCGEGLKNISIESRAIISSLISHLGVKCAYFPIDDITMQFIYKTRGIEAFFIKEYFQKQELYGSSVNLAYDEHIEFDLTLVEQSIANVKKLQEKVILQKVPSRLKSFKKGNLLRDNDIVLAMLSSYTFTLNPYLFIQAALVAKKAISYGLEINQNIKRVIVLNSSFLKECYKNFDFFKYFEKLGFEIIEDENIDVKLIAGINEEIQKYDLNVSSLQSSDKIKNSKELINIKSNWFMSPALVIAYCFKGSVNFNILNDELQKNVYLKDILPSKNEIDEYIQKIDTSFYEKAYSNLFFEDKHLKDLKYKSLEVFPWEEQQNSTRFEIYKQQKIENIEINEAKVLFSLDFESLKKYDENFVLFTDEFSKDSFQNLEFKKLRNTNIKAVVTNSFDEEYRQNLIKVGVLPLRIKKEELDTLKLEGGEILTMRTSLLQVKDKVKLDITKNNEIITTYLNSTIQTQEELLCFKSGGIIPYLVGIKTS